MLITIGKRNDEPSTLRSRLLDCHTRIRKLCALGRRLSEGGPPYQTIDQTRDAAVQLQRYFGIALPLHIRDEDESLRPRLERLGDSALLDALGAMSREHAEADVVVAELLGKWDAIVREPTDARCSDTRAPVVWLEGHLLAHLHDEETLIFPALDLLPRAHWDAIVAEMQARRR
jgi:hypothetical protein